MSKHTASPLGKRQTAQALVHQSYHPEAMATSGAGHCNCVLIKCYSGRRVAYLEGQRLHCIVVGPVIPSIPTQVDVPGRGQQSPEPLQHTKQYETKLT